MRGRTELLRLRNLTYWMVGIGGLAAAVAGAQDRFPATVPVSNLIVGIQDFATLPDASNNLPARANLLLRDPLGRLVANDQLGPMYLIDDNGANVNEYLDLRDYSDIALIDEPGERGFQGFAFHPDFATSGAGGYGKFYTIHSSSNTSVTPDFDPGGSTAFHTLLLEWTTDDPTSSTFIPANDESPYREVIRFKQPYNNHNAGLIAFNSSIDSGNSDYGNLYVAIGDGGSGNDPQENGQDPGNPYGAILRIDPLGSGSANGKYGIVADNALASDSDEGTIGEIYTYGLRNPQRFGWDAATGDMYIADIGQNAVEEINLAVNGGNYGWDVREGSFGATGDFIDPVAEYDHTNVVSNPPTSIGNRAVTVGDVPRGTNIPNLDGVMVMSDFPTGLLFTLDVDSDPLDGGQDGLRELQPIGPSGQPVRLLNLINAARSSRGLGTTNRADIRFGINTPGEMYILNKRDGIIRRLVVALPGDYNGDGTVDTADYGVWKSNFGSSDMLAADGNGDGLVDAADYAVWRDNLGAALATDPQQLTTPVPEPPAAALAMLMGMILIRRRSRASTAAG